MASTCAVQGPARKKGAGWLLPWDVKVTKKLDRSPCRKLFGLPYPLCHTRVICAPLGFEKAAPRSNGMFFWVTATAQKIQLPGSRDSCPCFQVRWTKVLSNRFDKVGKEVSSSQLNKVVKQASSNRLEKVGKRGLGKTTRALFKWQNLGVYGQAAHQRRLGKSDQV